MNVLGISGSLRRDSHNRRLLLEAAELLPAGVEFELYAELKAVPPYDEDDDGEEVAPEVERLRDAIAGADAVLIATPGVQLVGSRPAEERDRLGVAPARRRRARRQAGRRDRHEHRVVRRRLGAGRPPQDPRHRRREGRRRRAHRARVHMRAWPRTGACSTTSCASGRSCSWMRSSQRRGRSSSSRLKPRRGPAARSRSADGGRRRPPRRRGRSRAGGAGRADDRQRRDRRCRFPIRSIAHRRVEHGAALLPERAPGVGASLVVADHHRQRAQLLLHVRECARSCPGRHRCLPRSVVRPSRKPPQPLRAEDGEDGEDRVAGDAPLADRVDHRDLDVDQVDAEYEAAEDDRGTDRGRLDPGGERRREHGRGTR